MSQPQELTSPLRKFTGAKNAPAVGAGGRKIRSEVPPADMRVTHKNSAVQHTSTSDKCRVSSSTLLSQFEYTLWLCDFWDSRHSNIRIEMKFALEYVKSGVIFTSLLSDFRFSSLSRHVHRCDSMTNPCWDRCADLSWIGHSNLRQLPLSAPNR